MRVPLKADEKTRGRFTLKPSDLQILGRDMQWRVEAGMYAVMAAASSEDIRLRGTFQISGAR